MKVVDASAVLAFLQGEPGSDVVAGALESGACCASVNWSEVAQKLRARGRDWDLARALLRSYEIVIEPVTEEDAELAAELWRAGSGMSLADRLCLALGRRRDLPVLTADTHWGSEPAIIQIRGPSSRS